MRRTIIYVIALIVLITLAVAAYQFAANFTYTRNITLPPHLLASSSTDAVTSGSDATATSSLNVFGVTDPAVLNPVSSTVSTASWKKYSNTQFGFSVKYPNDFIANTGAPNGLILSVPKDHYFQWPLLDDVKISVIATSTCPEVILGTYTGDPESVVVYSNVFLRTQGTDVGAGNIYREIAYDLVVGSVCYHIALFDHGANGSGLYVSDQSLIKRYDAEHQKNIHNLLGIFSAIVASFQLDSML